MIREISTIKIDATSLRIGMFVSKLDMPWSATAYPMQGFLIEQEQQIEQLCQLCSHVFVDLRLSKHLDQRNDQKLELAPTEPPKQRRLSDRQKWFSTKTNLNKYRFTHYEIKTEFRKELLVANEVYQNANQLITSIVNRCCQLNKQDLISLKAISSRMVKSALHNPDALNWVAKINNSFSSLFQQILNSTVTGVLFARHLGLEQRKIEFLTMSLLLRCIGISKLDKALLVKYKPTDVSKSYFKHLDLTLEELEKFKNIPEIVVNSIANHCERFDGLGYPLGKSHNRIPLLSQVIHLITFYEDLVNPLLKTKAISASSAVALINARREQNFSSELVTEFVKAIGIFPTGSFVELNDKTKAMVVEQNRQKRLRSIVAVVSNEVGVNLEEPQLIDLSLASSQHLSITKSISANQIDTEQVIRCQTLFNKKPNIKSRLKSYFNK